MWVTDMLEVSVRVALSCWEEMLRVWCESGGFWLYCLFQVIRRETMFGSAFYYLYLFSVQSYQ
jgi:hypothetical protein